MDLSCKWTRRVWKIQRLFNSEEKIDLIISDINMPILWSRNGRKIRELDSIVPLIYTTARSETENIIKAIDLNVSSYILKLIDTAILIKNVWCLWKEIYPKSN